MDSWTRLASPVFILSPIGSGSTLLRCIIDSHSRLYAPHEFHLRYLEVVSSNECLNLSLEIHEISSRLLRVWLWDRIYWHDLRLILSKNISDGIGLLLEALLNDFGNAQVYRILLPAFHAYQAGCSSF